MKTVYSLLTSIVTFVIITTNLYSQSYHKMFPKDQDLGTFVDIEIDKATGILYSITACGELIKSNDDGSTWSTLKEDLDASASSELMLFPNESGTMIHKKSTSILEITKDEGATWSSIKPSGSYLGLQLFEGGKIIIPSNSGVHISYDHGANWSLDTNLRERGNLSFLDSNTGFLMNFDGDLWKTTDAAKTWTQIYAETGSLRIDQIHFFTPLLGYKKKSSDLFKTLDGGLTWTHISGYPVLYEMEFIDSLNLITFHGGSVFLSIDGGSNWLSAEPQVDYNYVSSCFKDINNIFIAGSRKTICKTTDLGQTWVKKSSAPVMASILDFEFINKDLGLFVAQDSSIVYTKDGGKTWEIKKGELYNEIAVTSDGKAYLYGNSGIVYTSDLENYTTVSTVNLQYGNQYIYSPNGTLYYKNTKRILRSFDKGLTRDTIKQISDRYISSLHIRSDNKIYFTTSTGFVYYTLDGGNSWDSANVGEGINDISWVSDNEAFLTCNDSIRHTKDGFATFKATSRRYYGFKGVKSVSADTVYSFYGSSSFYGPGYIQVSGDSGATFRRVYDQCFAISQLAVQPGSKNIWMVSDGGEVGFYGIPESISDTTGGMANPSLKVKKELEIFPNPASTILNYNLVGKQKAKMLVVYDVSGKIVVTETGDQMSRSLDIKDLKPGIYLLEVLSSGNRFTRKFVKD